MAKDPIRDDRRVPPQPDTSKTTPPPEQNRGVAERGSDRNEEQKMEPVKTNRDGEPVR